ncbi:transposase [Desulfamplus magnetovallimortis]|uniref:transposase n=1 Tax=Desulfamplus magnetovallimortis TaxID=1246637 RepID=UPI001645DF40|nr:transposase [Desulfamplus magnetovallimortis]
MYDLLFRSVADTLLAFGHEPKWAGGKIGFSWCFTPGVSSPVHPHIHCVIPGGAYDEATGEWIHHKYERNNFLYPVKALSRVFRGKFISGLEDAFCRGELNFPEELASMDGCGNILNGDAEEFIEIRRERQQNYVRKTVEVMNSS